MVHPFEEILSGCDSEELDAPKASRRRVLKIAAGGVVAAVAAQATGQVATTLAIGEEGGRVRPPKRPIATTKAIGEEGGNPGIIGVPGKAAQISKYMRDFRVALKAGDVETAADNLKKLEDATKSAKGRNPYKRLVEGYRKQLDAALTGKLKRADKDLASKKLVPAIKAYRAVSRVNGFKQQDQAKSKLTEVAKLDGYAEALSEVEAQELYDTAAKTKKNCDKLAIYQQVAKDYEKTPTGKKAAKQAGELDKRLKSDETKAAGLLTKARKAKGSTQVRMLQGIVARYPDTESGKIAAQMLPKKAPRPKLPRPGGPIATTMAIGEEG